MSYNTERLRQVPSLVTQPIGEFYCRNLLHIRPEFPELNPLALTLLMRKSESHVRKHKSVIEGHPLPTEGPALIFGNHRAADDNYKLCVAGVRVERLIRPVVKKGLAEKGFRESDQFLASIEAQDESLEYSAIMAFVLKGVGSTFIDRERLDREFLTRTDQVITSRQMLGTFLQAHRYSDGTLKYPQIGAASLSRRHPDAPIYLFASSGAPDGTDRLTFLEPFTYAQLQQQYGRKLSAGELTIIFADRVATALPERPRLDWIKERRAIEAAHLKVDLNTLHP